MPKRRRSRVRFHPYRRSIRPAVYRGSSRRYRARSRRARRRASWRVRRNRLALGIKPETKLYEFALAASTYAPDSTFTSYNLLSSISQGDAANNREGAEIVIKRIEYKLFWSEGQTPVTTDLPPNHPIRFLMWREKDGEVMDQTIFRSDAYGASLCAYPFALNAAVRGKRRILVNKVRKFGCPTSYSATAPWNVKSHPNRRRSCKFIGKLYFPRGLRVRFSDSSKGENNQIKFCLMSGYAFSSYTNYMYHHFRIFFSDI